MTRVNFLKIIVVASLATVGWSLAMSFSELFEPESVSRHLAFAIFVFTYAVVLVTIFYKLDKKDETIKFDTSKQLKKFCLGFLWFAVPALVLLAAVSFLGVIEVDILKSPGEMIVGLLLVSMLVLLSEAIPEEIVMRGYIFSRLAKSGRVWLTVFIQAVLFTIFALFIGALSDPLDASFIFTFGALLGIIRSVTGSVAAPIGFHLACMTFQQSFGERWEIFSVSNESMLQMYIFGMIPISVASAYFVTKILNSKNQ